MQDVLRPPVVVADRVRRSLLPIASIGVIGLLWLGSGVLVPAAWAPYTDRFRTFVTIFLGIFIEALPFLLAGVLVSSAIHLFMTPERLQRLLPRQAFASALTGSLLGLVFPVCECGSVPAARQLLRKGAPLPLGIAFMLASPVVNPIVIISTAVAFGNIFGWEFVAWRVGLTVAIAVIVSLVIGSGVSTEHMLARRILAPVDGPHHDHAHAHDHGHDHHDHDHDHDHDDEFADESRIGRVLTHAGEEFFEMSRFLVIGGLLAAGLQTFIAP
ncbi:MAG: permease, partial [Roseiflexaceae bacterium]|nr:permease [Roseiflexaceae bacterium]